MVTLKKAFHKYDSSPKINLPDIEIEKGRELLITGLSGSGKSTLLHILAGILKPSSGELIIEGTNIYSLSEVKRDAFRGKKIGVVYQQLHLIDSLSVKENIKLAIYLSGSATADEKVRQVCAELDIAEKMNAYPDELSQGQKQRVAIARAVINNPAIILADEPTSSLDDVRSRDVLTLLKSMARKSNAALILTTHDQRVKDAFEHQIDLNQLARQEEHA